MFDFIKNLFKPETSGATARERLRLVLLSDHLSLAPDVVAALRRDLIEVISRYVEVDEANTDVTFEQQDSAVAMLANIPILALRARPLAPKPPTPVPEPPPAFSGGATASAAIAHEPEVEETTAITNSPAPAAAPKRRRRRRRPAGQAAPAAG